MVDEADKLHRKVAAHAHGTEGIKEAVRAGVASVEHGSILDEEAIAMMIERGTYLVPTLMAGYAVERQAEKGILTGFRAEKALYIAPIMRRSFRMAVEAGVPIAFGTDAGVFPHGTNGTEFEMMVENGMDPMAAIVSATGAAADLLGMADRVGTLKPGMLADIVAVPGDPLDDIRVMQQAIFVMKAGEVVVHPEPEVQASS
jgi:imidazolonepropionase-like amidohydrolase